MPSSSTATTAPVAPPARTETMPSQRVVATAPGPTTVSTPQTIVTAQVTGPATTVTAPAKTVTEPAQTVTAPAQTVTVVQTETVTTATTSSSRAAPAAAGAACRCGGRNCRCAVLGFGRRAGMGVGADRGVRRWWRGMDGRLRSPPARQLALGATREPPPSRPRGRPGWPPASPASAAARPVERRWSANGINQGYLAIPGARSSRRSPAPVAPIRGAPESSGSRTRRAPAAQRHAASERRTTTSTPGRAVRKRTSDHPAHRGVTGSPGPSWDTPWP